MSDLIEESAKAFYQASISKPAFRIRPPKTWDEMLPEIKAELGENLRAVFSRLDALGYAVVPKEPTPEMVEAGVAAFTNIHDIYRAMLAAKEGPK